MSRKGRDPEWVHLDKQFPPTKKSSFIDMVPGKYFFMIIGLILIAFVIYVSIHQSEIIINDIDDIDFSDTEFELFNEDNLEEYVPDNKPVNLKIGTDNDWSEFFASDPDENDNWEQDGGSLPGIQTFIHSLQNQLSINNYLKHIKTPTNRTELQNLINILPLPQNIKNFPIPSKKSQISTFILTLKKNIKMDAPELANIINNVI